MCLALPATAVLPDRLVIPALPLPAIPTLALLVIPAFPRLVIPAQAGIQ